jgi:hypothetical protein
MTSLLAMLFLVIFSALAIGFYAQTNMSAQVSANERRAVAAQVAAESGLQFIRYHLSKVNVPAATKDSAVFQEVYLQLSTALDGTPNLAGAAIGYDGKTISIPADAAGRIAIAPGGAGFRATLAPGRDRDHLLIDMVGTDGRGTLTQRRGIRTEFLRKDIPTTVFDYGIASRGSVLIKSSPATKVLGTPDASGSILSTFAGAPAIMTGNGPVEGDLTVASTKAQAVLGGGAVGGSTDPAVIRAKHVHVVAPPLFPDIDTSPFKPFATNVYVAGAATQTNIVVPPNTNPKFNAGDVVNGILYVESPNSMQFGGNATINGIIVFENKGDPTVNSMDFRGNVSPKTIPNTPDFDALRAAAKGWAIAAPTASVTMSGSVDATLDGTIVASYVSLAGSADLTFTNGSIVALGSGPTWVQGKAVTFNGTAAANLPVTGVRFNFNYLPDMRTYLEYVP